MIKTIILKWLGSNLDNLIGFLQDLDKSLDGYVDKQMEQDAQLDAERVRIEEDQRRVRANAATAINLKGGLRGITEGKTVER